VDDRTEAAPTDLARQVERTARYVAELQTWGARMNLVGSLEDSAIRLHIRDAERAADLLPRHVDVVDLGSGAGFPGIPVAIRRVDLRMTLVEGRERRVHFLRHVARVTGLACDVLHQRIEAVPSRAFDFALLRAVAPPDEALRMALPWVAAHGEIWLWTRMTGAELGLVEAHCVPIDARGERGHILRVPARAVSAWNTSASQENVKHR
jgi:16S rRNA (guanine527-N7)-methyltransferase